MKRTMFSIIILSVLLTGCSIQQPSSSDISGRQNTSSTEVSKENSETNNNKQVDNKLDLSSQNLNKIPEYVFGLKKLEELNVSNNNLTGAIQAEIRQLESLKILNASNNQMTGLPAEVGQLRHLEVLNLANNQLTGLPYELGNLENLKVLNISGNDYSELDLNIIKEKLPAEVQIIK